MGGEANEVDEAEEDEEWEDEEWEDERAADPAQLYVTDVSTVVVLHIITLGLYSLYWFYRHWSVQKRARRLRVSPLLRAIFPVFFVHRLFRNIDRAARVHGKSPAWTPNSQATLFIVVLFGARIVERIPSDAILSGLVDIAALFALLIPLIAAQQVANLTRIDEDEDEDEDEVR